MAKSEVVEEIPMACSNELAAVEFLEAKIWQGKPECPHCHAKTVSQIMDAKTGQRNHCHPVLAIVDRCNTLNVSDMRVNGHVSESDSNSAFFGAADMPNWGHARWKTDFFATDGVDSPRTISPLCGAL
jgi:hypothetical protein